MGAISTLPTSLEQVGANFAPSFCWSPQRQYLPKGSFDTCLVSWFYISFSFCLVAQLGKNPPAMRETWVWSLGWEDPLEKGKGYPLQYFGLENPMDCTVYLVTKSRTQLSDLHFHFTCATRGYLYITWLCWLVRLTIEEEFLCVFLSFLEILIYYVYCNHWTTWFFSLTHSFNLFSFLFSKIFHF